MKNYTILICLLISVLILSPSCSKEEDAVVKINTSFNPPEWLQGYWWFADLDAGWNINADDFMPVSKDSLQADNTAKEAVAYFQGYDIEVTVNEVITNTSYKAEIRSVYMQNSFLLKYEFELIDKDTLLQIDMAGLKTKLFK